MTNKEILLEINNRTIKSNNLIELKNNHCYVSEIQNNHFIKIGISDYFIYLSRGYFNDQNPDRHIINRSNFKNYQIMIEHICVIYDNLLRDDQIELNKQLQRSKIYNLIIKYFKIDNFLGKDEFLQFIFNEYLISISIYDQFKDVRLSISIQDSDLNEIDYNQFIGIEKEVIDKSIKFLEKYIQNAI